MYNLFLPYDIFERHKKVGSLINARQTVLDVGGELNHLSQFCSPRKIVVANLTKGDVIISKRKLPFAKDYFDTVCAIDVLEHIPNKEKKSFIKRLCNVASDKVILSFPIGTNAHKKYEIETQKWLKKKGKYIEYLNEHIRFGLPNFQEINKLMEPYESKVFYSGNININKFLFRLYMFDPNIKFFRKVIYYLKLFFNLLTNDVFYRFLSEKSFSDLVNRAYVVIYKK